MKRDMELVRRILLAMESTETWGDEPNLNFEGISNDLLNYHIMLLDEAGLLKAENVSSLNDIEWIPLTLTWQGYEFLEATKNKTAWEKTKELMSKSGGFVFEVAKPLLTSFILQQLTGSK